MNRFSVISVRDQNSYNIIKKLCNREPILNLDPVLVSGVEKESWNEPTLKNYMIVYGYANRFSDDEKKEIQDVVLEYEILSTTELEMRGIKPFKHGVVLEIIKLRSQWV